jgi:hypothetical protein
VCFLFVALFSSAEPGGMVPVGILVPRDCWCLGQIAAIVQTPCGDWGELVFEISVHGFLGLVL